MTVDASAAEHVPMPPPGALWAKLGRDDSKRVMRWHSLVDHSADVAAVVMALLGEPTFNKRLAAACGRVSLNSATCRRLGALAFLHDIGKANRGFRRRVDPHAPLIGHIDELAWVFKAEWGRSHAERLDTVLGLTRTDSWFATDAAWELWDAVFAHHGRPWNADAKDATAHWKKQGEDDPIAGLAVMRAALDRWFADAFADGPPLPDTAAFCHAFAGLLMLADWLGSDEQFFPFANGEGADRMALARRAAADALHITGLAVEPHRAALANRPADFATLFAGRPPRPAQRDAIQPTARCVVLEAETGSGKTEAALWRFRHLFAKGDVDGLYFALPTRVAATQIFARVRRFRDALFPADDRPAVVLAVPGQIGADDATGHPLPDFNFEWTDHPDAATRQARWAAEHPKRFLAAQIAVGTIDQALLAAVSVRHAHLRGTALLRHLLVVDEVHASDRYMETLLGNLLRGHLAAGGHALLLSATLGAGMRARLLGTDCPTAAEAETLPYPALGWAEGRGLITHAIGSDKLAPPNKRVQIQAAPLIDDPAAIAAEALCAAEAGARVLVIRNTVAAAIATAEALEAAAGAAHPALFRVGEVATLHHGRFAPADRLALDAAVEAALDRGAAAPVVVVGTQTLEQSLDLDADLLLTDLCPVDVLLQRIGRLHRHAHGRPPSFVTATAMVLTPPSRDLLVLLGRRRGRHGLGLVYDDARSIEATWRLIETEPAWVIPRMNRRLVERATHPAHLTAIEAELCERDAGWRPVFDKVYGNAAASIQQARLGLLDRAAPFSAFRIDEKWATRLGAQDLLAALPPGTTGPFGSAIDRLLVPHFLAEGASDADAAEVLAADADGLLIRLGPARLRYDRFGLRGNTQG